MSFSLESLRELLVVLLDVAKRRWKLFLVPPLVAILLGSCAMRAAPTKYTATSLILLQGANRPSNQGWQPQLSPLDQVGAIEAWLKSDQVLNGLLPALNDGVVPANRDARDIAIRILRAQLSLELVGNSVLQIDLASDKPQGLGRKLEIIIARLLEALVGPDQGLFNASQFVITTRGDALKAADDELNRVIATLPTQPPEGVRTKLRQIIEAQNQLRRANAAQPGAQDPATLQATIDKLRGDLSSDQATVERLEQLFAAQQSAKIALDATATAASTRAYVGVFAAPENLVVIGRPQDPLFGQNSAMKLVIAMLLLSLIIAFAVVFAIELLSGRLRMRREFENATDLPVIARMPRISGRI